MNDSQNIDKKIPITTHIRRDMWRWLILCIFFVGFVFISETNLNEVLGRVKASKPTKVKIGLYRRAKGAFEYFGELKEGLIEGFAESDFDLEFTQYTTVEELTEALRRDDLMIAGELSAIEYVDLIDKGGFSPFLSLEYDEQTFYRSYMFVPEGAPVIVPKDSPVESAEMIPIPGEEYLTLVLWALKDGGYWIAHPDGDMSASGYVYPLAFLYKLDISDGPIQPLADYKEVYEKVLTFNNNKMIAGIMADYQLKYLQETKERIERCWSDENKKWPLKKRLDRLVETEDKMFYARFGDCAPPLVIERLDPIPHGLFVISNKASQTLTPELKKKLQRVWKTIDDVTVGGSAITGWRIPIDHDYWLVKSHWDYVRAVKSNAARGQIVIVLVVCVLALVLFAIWYVVIHARQ